MTDYTVKTQTVKDTIEGYSYLRTGIVIDPVSNVASFDLLAPDGSRLARINACFSDETQWVNVDVIDVDGVWLRKRLLAFANGGMTVNANISQSSLGAVEFSGRKEDV